MLCVDNSAACEWVRTEKRPRKRGKANIKRK